MQADEYVRMAEVQAAHWWFEAKRRTVGALLARHLTSPAVDGRVLEIGAGPGPMIDVIRPYGRAFVADAYLPALAMLAAHRCDAGVIPVGADLLRLPFEDARFSLIGCFDVLYHQGVADVGAALDELHRVCASGGYLAITDSAFPFLRSSHDVATHAARRFRLGDLTGPLERAGFTIEHATYFHTLLFPPAALVRLAKRALHGSPPLEQASETSAAGAAAVAGRAADERSTKVPARSDLAPVAPWLNAALLGLYRLEIPLTVRMRMPFGVSLLILARRPPR